MTTKNVTQVHHTTEGELIKKILTGVEDKLKNFEKQFQPKEPDVWMTRKEVAELLSISLVTVSKWSRDGVLKPITIGKNRVRFNRSEVLELLTKKH